LYTGKLRLMTYILSIIMLDKSLKPHKDANEVALYFTEIALRDIV